jgi:hypothetical protein
MERTSTKTYKAFVNSGELFTRRFMLGLADI